MNEDHKEPDLSHTDSAIRLASVVHRFRMPMVFDQSSFQRAFKTASKSHGVTTAAMIRADSTRKDMIRVLKAKRTNHEQVVMKCQDYVPLIHQILFTCKVQPESARLDERLLFEWASGVEKVVKNDEADKFESEALMYDLVMAMACEGLGQAGWACEDSAEGDFAGANRKFGAAAGLFEFLEKDHLPQWVARGTVDEDHLPMEATVGGCAGLKLLFLANAQQMAVATVLIKPGTPNYSLVAKLCLGVAEKLESFVSTMRKDAFHQMSKMDKEFFTLVTFQVNLQRSLSLYFQARSLWDTDQNYGLAIALVSEATQLIATRSTSVGTGIPDLTKTQKLHTLQDDVVDLRAHMAKVLKTWEKDNSHVYFDRVPPKVPEDDKLEKGVFIAKIKPYEFFDDVDPLPLSIPDASNTTPATLTRSDSDLARELHEKLNNLGS